VRHQAVVDPQRLHVVAYWTEAVVLRVVQTLFGVAVAEEDVVEPGGRYGRYLPLFGFAEFLACAPECEKNIISTYLLEFMSLFYSYDMQMMALLCLEKQPVYLAPMNLIMCLM